jgi:hypothetical protein
MQTSKTVTAKLLATENITVMQDKVRTASFDVKNRVLTLPLWADVADYTEDHLIGHEVGHALYTPLEGWHDAVCDRGPNFKSFLNVVEDARIEKLIQRKYPGLRPLFIKSYRKLLADGFFGGTIDSINEMGLIDRINTYFKCGLSAGVQFTATEQQWIPRIEKLETWDEVVALTEELFEFCKQQMEDQQQAKEEADANADPEDLDDEEDDDDSDNFSFSDDDDDDVVEDWEELLGSAADTDGEGEEQETDELGEQGSIDDADEETDEQSDGDAPANTPEGGFGSNFDQSVPSAKTDDNLRNAIDSLVDDDRRTVTNFTISVPKTAEHIISYKEILKEIRGEKPVGAREEDEYFMENWRDTAMRHMNSYNTIGKYLYGEWQRTNKKAVNHMVKEFEMKKQASEFARASTAKTGVIDTIKMNNYKLTDDIFKKVTVLPEGKNHAFVMFLDMSGSMSDYMYETVEQTLLLTHFCRQIGVPFRVYGFTDRFASSRWSASHNEKYRTSEYYVAEGISLLELFTNDMNKAELTAMAERMLYHYARINRNWERSNRIYDATRISIGSTNTFYSCFDLGGTPLDSAIVIGIPVINQFRVATRADIMNVVFLTDGSSHEMEVNGSGFRSNNYNFSHTTITSPWSNKSYKSRNIGMRNTMQTELLLEMLKDETGANVIGYFIAHQSKGHFMNAYKHQSGVHLGWESEADLWKQARTDGFLPVNAVGYDEFFIVGHKSLQITDGKMEEVNGETTKAKLRTAFKKAQVGGRKSRKMLNDIVSRVA